MALVDLDKSRLYPRTTLASVESLTIPLVQEVVILADFGCTRCQKRVADIISRMNGEVESVVVSRSEKKVTLTCRYPTTRVVNVPAGQVGVICKKSVNKLAFVTRLLCSSLR